MRCDKESLLLYAVTDRSWTKKRHAVSPGRGGLKRRGDIPAAEGKRSEYRKLSAGGRGDEKVVCRNTEFRL